MKKILSTVICSSILFASCGSDDDGGSGVVVDPTQPVAPVIDGVLNVEEGKKQLEDNSISFLNKVESFKNDNALNEIVKLAEFLEPKEETAKKTTNVALKTISNVADLKTNDRDIIAFNAAQAADLASLSLKADFLENKGVYNWNTAEEDFDKVGNSDDHIYNITYNGKTAIFSITDFDSTLVEGEEVPTLVNAELKINNTIVFSQQYSATFKGGQVAPVTFSNTTSMGGMSIVTNYSNKDDKNLSKSIDFNLGGENIMSFKSALNGNFNVDSNDGALVEDVVDNATLSFSFLNATLFMTANDNSLNSNENLNIDQQIALLNSNVAAELSINRKSIAKSQFYKDKDTYWTYVYDPNTDYFDYQEVEEDIVNARFLFDDGSSADFDTYINGSFSGLENKFNAVFDAYEVLFENIDLGEDDDEYYYPATEEQAPKQER